MGKTARKGRGTGGRTGSVTAGRHRHLRQHLKEGSEKKAKGETPVMGIATLREGITPRILGEGSSFRQGKTNVAQTFFPCGK
jgi:hypothetical protein